MPVRNIKAGYLNTTSASRSRKLDRGVKAESSLEADFLFLNEHDPSVVWFDEQPLVISYQLENESFERTYTPDLLTKSKLHSGVEIFTLYEVKFRSELKKSWMSLKPKFKAAIHVCKLRGWKFKIVTEKEIRTIKLRNLEFLFHFSRTVSPIESDLRSVIFNGLLQLDVATPDELLAYLFRDNDKRAEALPVLWRMIFSSAISFDWDRPLTLRSQLSLVKEYEL
jgi:TnsA endonuclease N terminal/TnsA endonuclease C terminal